MTWLSWLSLAILTTASEKCLNRYFLSDTNDYWGYLVGYNIGAMLFLFGVSGLPTLPTDHSLYGLLLLSGLLWLFVCIFTFKADQHVEASISSLISQLQLVLVCLGGILFLGETISLTGFLGIVAILFGILFLDFKGSLILNRNPGIIFKLLAVVTISAVLLIDKRLIQQIDAQTITFFGYLTPLAFALVSSPKKIIPALRLSKRLKYMNAALGALSCISYYCLVRSMKTAPISLVLPLYQIQIVVVFVLSYFFLNERQHSLKKLISSAIILFGASLIMGME